MTHQNPSLIRPPGWRGEEAVLQIGTTSSSCSACNRGADPYEKTHETALGYFESSILDNPDAPERKGCGARYVKVASLYMGLYMEENIKRMRPDLPLTKDLWL